MGSQIPSEPNFNKYIQYCNMKTLEENFKDRMRARMEPELEVKGGSFVVSCVQWL